VTTDDSHGHYNGKEDNYTAHRGCPLLDKMMLGAVSADLLAYLPYLEDSYPDWEEYDGEGDGDENGQKNQKRWKLIYDCLAEHLF